MNSASPQAVHRSAFIVQRFSLLAPFAAWALPGLLLLVAVLLAWRRAAGALVAVPGPALLLSAGAVAVCLTAAVREAAHRLRPARNGSPSTWLRFAIPSTAVLIFAAAMSLPGASPGALGGLWAVVIVEELWAVCAETRRRRRGRAWPTGSEPAELGLFPPIARNAEPPAREVLAPEPGELAPGAKVMQQLTRSQASDGSEVLAGWVRVWFAPGQRTASAHVAFCPPLARTPSLAVQQRGGPAARVKTGQLLPYGARLDVKLAAASQEPAAVVLHFSAQCPAEAIPPTPPSKPPGAAAYRTANEVQG